MCCRVFLDGAVEFFILPTAWYYVVSLWETKVFFGFVLSAYSISAPFVGPIVGRLHDRFGSIKDIATICFTLHAVGNLVYSIPMSAYFPLMGLFISGMGNAIAGVFYAQIALYTNEKYCAQSCIFLDGMFTLGAPFGPNCFDNRYGLSCCWLDYSCQKRMEKKRHHVEKQCQYTMTNTIFRRNKIELILHNVAVTLPSFDYSTSYFFLFLLYASTMVTFYTPLLASEHFNLQFTDVKLLFLNSFLFPLSLFLLLYIVAEYFDERNLLASLKFSQIFATAILTYFAFRWENSSYSEINGYFLIVYICLGMPYFQFGLSCWLLLKITASGHNSAFYQGSSYPHFILRTFLVAWLKVLYSDESPYWFSLEFC